MNILSKIPFPASLKTSIKRCLATIRYKQKAAAMTRCALSCKSMGVTSQTIADADVIVSLTTFGKRLHEVYLAIESIMQATVKPNRIILWLAYEHQGQTLPQELQNQQARGLEIRYCNDTRSYKKLIPTLCLCPDSIIVTIDDDAIYAPHFLADFLAAHAETPHHVLAKRVHRVKLCSDGTLAPYAKWTWESRVEDASQYNFLTGCGGVLYPKHCFCDEVLNEDAFLELCRNADDVWFYAMAIKSQRLIRKIHTKAKNSCDFLENPDVQDVGLFNTNLKAAQNGNDVQLRAVFQKYDLYKLMTPQT